MASPTNAPLQVQVTLNLFSGCGTANQIQGTPRGAIPTTVPHQAHLWALDWKGVFNADRYTQDKQTTANITKTNTLRSE